jgi:hypothetical protein
VILEIEVRIGLGFDVEEEVQEWSDLTPTMYDLQSGHLRQKESEVACWLHNNGEK